MARQRQQKRPAVVAEPGPGDVTVSLTSQERLIVNNLLPVQGSLLTMRSVQRLRESLLFSDEELDTLEIEATDNPDGTTSFVWGPDGGKTEANIVFTSRMFVLVGTTLRDLDAAQQLAVAHLPLWDKFVPKGEVE